MELGHKSLDIDPDSDQGFLTSFCGFPLQSYSIPTPPPPLRLRKPSSCWQELGAPYFKSSSRFLFCFVLASIAFSNKKTEAFYLGLHLFHLFAICTEVRGQPTRVCPISHHVSSGDQAHVVGLYPSLSHLALKPFIFVLSVCVSGTVKLSSSPDSSFFSLGLDSVTEATTLGPTEMQVGELALGSAELES